MDRKADKERWKPIEGTNGEYEISSHGRLRSNYEGRGVSPSRDIPYILSPSKNPKTGYMQTAIRINGKAKTVSIHRLVASHFLPKSEKKWVNHKDCDPSNNNVDNLEWCTPSENTKYSRNKGRMNNSGFQNGESHHNSKLTKDDVIEMRKYYENNDVSYSDLGEIFGVYASAAYNIVNRNSWKHI